MALNTGYAAYANNKVMTASPAELTLMLYDGAIKFCNIAIRAIEEGDVEKAHNNIVKVENIIDEFTENRQTVVKALCLHISRDIESQICSGRRF